MTKIFAGNTQRKIPHIYHGKSTPLLVLEQLNKDMDVVARFTIPQIPATGVSVSRPGAEEGSIRLSDSLKEACTVSQCHIRIGLDEKGFFFNEKVNGTTNGVYLYSGEKVCGASIHDGMIVYLGDQAVRFVLSEGSMAGATRIRD